MGLRVCRTADAFATTDGRGTLRIGDASSLDPDDCLAQVIFHELCHSLVQGAASFDIVDWGLDNTVEGRDLPAEHACLRVQAQLAGRHGLRRVLAPTTDHRPFYDRLPLDPLAADDASVVRARLGIGRASRPPWAPHLGLALGATASIVRATADHSPEGSLLSLVDAPVEPHPSGAFGHPDPGDRTCGACAWRAERCAVTGSAGEPGWTACEGFVAALDCRACAACCREAYGVVELEADDAFVAGHPGLVKRVDGRLELRRVDGRCPPLEGDGPYRCGLYGERPRSCREFEMGSGNCLEARRRTGLSP